MSRVQWIILEGFVRSTIVSKIQHPCPTGAATVEIAAVLFTVRTATGSKSYAVTTGRSAVIFTGNFMTSTSRMCFMHKRQRVCTNFCCSPSIDSQLVCRLVRLTFKCQAHRLSAAFRNILKGYTGEWNLKQLGVIPKDPQSKR